MARFTESNTEGFTATEISDMNAALEALEAGGFTDDENQISDFINNAYPATTAEYVELYKARHDPR